MDQAQIISLYPHVPPPQARLVGGPAHGQRFTLDGDRDTILVDATASQPLAERLLTTAHRAIHNLPPQATWTAVYRRTGIDDDGTRIYRYDTLASAVRP